MIKLAWSGILVVTLVILVCFSSEGLAQVNAETTPTSAIDERDSQTPAPAERQRNEVRRSYLIPAVEIVGFDFVLNRFNRRYIDREAFAVGRSSITRNLKSAWVVDADDFKTNQFQHPYQGALYHTAARSSGNSFWKSAIYTFAGSALWEIAGETTPPSKNDQVASGIGGVFLGEPLFRMANLTLERSNGLPGTCRAIGATAISPMTGLNRVVFGGRFDPIFPGNGPAVSSQWNFGSTVAEHRVEGAAPFRRNEAIADLSISYGLPGQPDFTYNRPFDYFSFEFTATTSNVFENILTRGLLIGRKYALGDSYRGLWGLYGSYDYMAPQVFRVSSTALSVGTTAQWGSSGTATVQGSALAGLGFGAGGATEGTDERDYHYGLTPQGLLTLRFVLGETVALAVAGRGYEITHFASTDHRGTEKIGRADASLTVRAIGRHGFTLRYLLTRRLAHYPDLGVRNQRRGAFTLSYSLLGDKDLGVVDWRSPE